MEKKVPVQIIMFTNQSFQARTDAFISIIRGRQWCSPLVRLHSFPLLGTTTKSMILNILFVSCERKTYYPVRRSYLNALPGCTKVRLCRPYIFRLLLLLATTDFIERYDNIQARKGRRVVITILASTPHIGKRLLPS